jgi:hypothetical protein
VAIDKVARHLAVRCTRIDGVPTQVYEWPLSLSILLNNSSSFWFLSFLTYKCTPIRGRKACYEGGVGCSNMFVRPLCLLEMTWTICAQCGRSLSRKNRSPVERGQTKTAWWTVPVQDPTHFTWMAQLTPSPICDD